MSDGGEVTEPESVLHALLSARLLLLSALYTFTQTHTHRHRHAHTHTIRNDEQCVEGDSVAADERTECFS